MMRPRSDTPLTLLAVVAALLVGVALGFFAFRTPDVGDDHARHLTAADSSRLVALGIQVGADSARAQAEAHYAPLIAAADSQSAAQDETIARLRRERRAEAHRADSLTLAYSTLAAEGGAPDALIPLCDSALAACTRARRTLEAETAVLTDAVALRDRALVLRDERHASVASAYDSLRLAFTTLDTGYRSLSEAERLAYRAGRSDGYVRGVWVGRFQIIVPIALGVGAYAVLK